MFTTKHLRALALVYPESWQLYHPNNEHFYQLKDLIEQGLVTWVDERDFGRLMAFGNHPSFAKDYLMMPTPRGSLIIEEAVGEMQKFARKLSDKP